MLKPYFWISAGALACTLLTSNLIAAESDKATVKDEHGDIGLGKETAGSHTQNPDAQWYPDAGLGLFIHWGIASVKAMNISWPMIPGRALAQKRIPIRPSASASSAKAITI